MNSRPNLQVHCFRELFLKRPRPCKVAYLMNAESISQDYLQTYDSNVNFDDFSRY